MRTLLLLLFPVLCSAQTDTAIHYTKVVEVPGLSKSQIFDKARLYLIDAVRYVVSSNQVQDKESGLIALNATTDCVYERRIWQSRPKDTFSMSYTFTYKLKIQIKDSRYKLEITDIIYVWKLGDQSVLTTVPLTSSSRPATGIMQSKSKAEKEWARVKENAAKCLNELMDKMATYIMNKKDDW